MKQVQFSSSNTRHSAHTRHAACHSRSGATLKRISSIIGCWQPKQVLNSETSELGEDEFNVGELEPEPVCVWGVWGEFTTTCCGDWSQGVLNAQCFIKTDLGHPGCGSYTKHTASLQKPISLHCMHLRLYHSYNLNMFLISIKLHYIKKLVDILWVGGQK